MNLNSRLVGWAARSVWRITKPRTLGARAVLLDDRGQVALVRHTYADHWYLPGGGVKKGESFESAVLRELQEEINVFAPKLERIIGVYHSRLEGKDDHIVVFAARMDQDPRYMVSADLVEISEVGWFPLDDLPSDTSPATRRRIADSSNSQTVHGSW